MTTLPTKPRGAGQSTCCPTHRDLCLFGRNQHVWMTWYENGALVRTKDTYRCIHCQGVCTAEEVAD